MKPGTITLTVVHGPLRRYEYVFEDGDRCVIGRADDCELRLPADLAHASVSRRHCMIEIEWPIVRIRDLGSRNGTFLNGLNIGQRMGDELPDESDLHTPEPHLLHDGDKIRVGHTLFRVSVGVGASSEKAFQGSETYVA